jgi:hypothetical protein
MSLYKSPNDPERNILTCPDCGKDNLFQIEPRDVTKHILQNDEAYSFYLDQHGDFNHQEPQMLCNHCLPSGPEWYDYVGINPLRKMNHVRFHPLKDPEINNNCNYPDECYCGECPNPDQMKFDFNDGRKWYR